MIFPNLNWSDFNPWGDRSPMSISRRMIREHSAWLTRMLASRRQPPRIPVRKVSEGGFARLVSTPSGRFRAERWWDRVLDADDD